MSNKKDFVVGSGNVFADLRVPRPEEALAKAELASRGRSEPRLILSAGACRRCSSPCSPPSGVPFGHVSSSRRKFSACAINSPSFNAGRRKDAPVPRAVQSPAGGMIVQVPHLGDLHHPYERRAA